MSPKKKKQIHEILQFFTIFYINKEKKKKKKKDKVQIENANIKIIK